MHRFVLPAGLLGVAQARVEWMTKFTSPGQDMERGLLPSFAEGGGFGEQRSADNYAQCEWRASGDKNEFKYDLTSETSAALADPLKPDGAKFDEKADSCFPNFFADSKSLYFPYPRSSYHYDLDKPWPPTAEQPRVTVDVNYDVTDTFTDVSKTLPAVDFETFETDGPKILYDAIPKSRGTYRFNVKAYDFDQIVSKDCPTCAVVNDLFRPKGDATKCPKEATASDDTFTSKNLKSYKERVEGVLEYSASAANNACSDDRCDTVYLKQKGIASKEAVVSFEDMKFSPSGAVVGNDDTKASLEDKWTKCMSAPFSNDEWDDLKTNPFQSADKIEYKTCKRSCEIGVELKEWFTEYTCAAKPEPLPPSRKQCVGDTTAQKCDVKESLAFPSGDTLVNSVDVNVKVNEDGDLKGKSSVAGIIHDPTELFGADKQYKSPYESNEVHFDSKCTSTNEKYADFCNFKVKLHDLFAFSGTIADDTAVKALFALTPTDAAPATARDVNEIVFWTVKVGETGTPELFTAATELTLSKFKTALTFEAHTACGKIGKTVDWTLFVHRHEPLVVTNWLNSLFSYRDNGCNVQESDFGVVEFKYSPTKSGDYYVNGAPAMLLANDDGDEDDDKENVDKDEVVIKWKFVGLKGVWQYTNAQAASSPWIDTSASTIPQGALAKAFAIKLQNAKDTTFKGIFDLKFGSLASVLTETAKDVSTNEFKLRNCDYPRFNVARPSDQGRYIKDTCDKTTWTTFVAGTSSWQPAPFQACGGALVFFDDIVPTATKTVLREQPKGLTCCNHDSLKTPFTCQLIKDSTTIQRCDDQVPAVVATLYLHDGYNQGHLTPQNVGIGETVLRNDLVTQTSSLKLVKGYELIGYKSDGTAKTWIGDVAWFERPSAATTWNDKITRVKVQKVSAANAVQFFKAPNYGDVATIYPVGNVDGTGAAFIVKSFHIQAGHELVLYPDANRQGTPRVFGEDVTDLAVPFKSFEVRSLRYTPPVSMLAATLEFVNVQFAPVMAVAAAVVVVAIAAKRRHAPSSLVDVEEGYVALMQ